MKNFKPDPERSYNFSKTLWASFCLVVGYSIILYWGLGTYNEADKIAYEKLIKGDQLNRSLETQVSKQERKNLQKDLYLNHKGQRLHLLVESLVSELVLEKTGMHTEVIEKLYGVSCWLQEACYLVLQDGRQAFPDSQGRFLIKGSDPQDPAAWVFENDEGIVKEQMVILVEASEAAYYYKGELFVANEVKLFRYVMPGHAIGKISQHAKLIAQATVSKMEFAFNGENIDFKAENFKLSFLDKQNFLNSSSDPESEKRIIISADYAEYKDDVIYLTNNAKINYELDALSINSSKMQISFGKDAGFRSPKKLEIHTFIAQGDVDMSFKRNFNAYCDYLFFKRIENIPSENEMLPGIITLNCDLPDRVCILTSLQGDKITSSKVSIDTIHQEVVFTNPNGSLIIGKEMQNPLNFSAETLVWNHCKSKLTFLKDVELTQNEVGNLRATDEVHIFLEENEEKKDFHGLEINGYSLLTYIHPITRHIYQLKSHRSLKIDHKKMEIKVRSPEDEKDSVPQRLQIHFKDPKGDMHADKGFLKYEYSNQKIIPSRIVLEGNVKITNRLEQFKTTPLKTEQYILADRVDFIPNTMEMIFKGKKGERVLLFDELNHLQVSAPGIKIIRDKPSQKETVSGIGDVRFNFNEGEINLLRRHFLLKGTQTTPNASEVR